MGFIICSEYSLDYIYPDICYLGDVLLKSCCIFLPVSAFYNIFRYEIHKKIINFNLLFKFDYQNGKKKDFKKINIFDAPRW